jgi:hypothetical protein
MRRFSRWMRLTVDKPWSVRAKIGLAFLVVATGALITFSNTARGVAGVVVIVFAVSWWRSDRGMRKLAASRAGEDLCSFAREFDRHGPEFDPWVIRAVWDALLPYRSFRGGVAPLRATDRLESFMDTDDLDMGDGLKELAARTGRTLEDLPANPLYGRVVTVADLVAFIGHQPHVERSKTPLKSTTGGLPAME